MENIKSIVYRCSKGGQLLWMKLLLARWLDQCIPDPWRMYDGKSTAKDFRWGIHVGVVSWTFKF